MNVLSVDSLSLAKEEAVLKEVADLPTLLTGAEPRAYCVVSEQHAERVPPSVQRRFGGGPAPAWWRPHPLIQCNAFRVFYLEKAYVVPKAGVVIDLDGQIMASSYGEAAYFFRNLTDILGDPGSGGSLIPDEGLETLRRQFVTLPWGAINNYGHFLLDGLTSTVFFQQAAREDWEFLFPSLQPWQRGHLDLLKIEQRGEHDADLVLCCGVMWTSNMDHHLHSPNATLSGLRRAYALPDPRATDLVWLSRAGDNKRHFALDEQLEAKLAELGFRILRPETLPPREQVQALVKARLVAGFTGAAFANALFCTPRAKVVEIQPSLMQGVWVRNLAWSVGCEWIPYFCPSSAPASPVIIGGQERGDIGIEILLDIADFLQFVSAVAAKP